MFEVIALQSLYNEIKDKKLPVKTTYKFTRLMRIVEEEIGFYQTEFQKILDEFAQKDSNGDYVFTPDKLSIQIIQGKTDECNARILELRNLEVKIDTIFSLDELEGLGLTVAQMGALMPLITE